MELDVDKIDRAVLAVLYLTLHNNDCAWKGVDWDALGRLQDRGLIDNPVSKRKSVRFSDQGLIEAEQACRALFEQK